MSKSKSKGKGFEGEGEKKSAKYGIFGGFLTDFRNRVKIA